MSRWISALGSTLRAILAREELPGAPAAAPLPKGPGALALLLAPEPLPEDPPAPARAGARWLAWLFAPERLDD